MKLKKIIIYVLIILITLIIFTNYVYADIDTNIKISNSTKSEFKPLFEVLIGFFQIVGSIISVVMLIVIGIKYMTSSVDGRAEYKKTMLPYLVGAIMVFATTFIVKFAYDFFSNI